MIWDVIHINAIIRHRQQVAYGKFSVSWTGNNSANAKRRLSDWLAPSLSNPPQTFAGTGTIAISGHDPIPCSTPTSYSVTRATDQSSVTWSVSSLQIVSGQNTNTVKVTLLPNATNASLTATVNLAGGGSVTAYRTVYTATPNVTYITWPASLNRGSTGSFVANPNSAAGNYQWLVSPSSGVSESPWKYTNNITFNSSGTYYVMCRAVSACASPGSYTSMTVEVYWSNFFIFVSYFYL